MQIYIKSYKKVAEYEASSKDKREQKELKYFQPYVGRIEFKDYFQLFNFNKNIYSDKIFKYGIIPNYNKRIIPEFASACISNLIYSGVIDLDVRMVIEQYIIAMMSNMDFVNIADLYQLKEFNYHEGIETKMYVFGSCSSVFGNDDYLNVISERLKTANIVYPKINGLLKKVKTFLRNEEYYKSLNNEVDQNFCNFVFSLNENNNETVDKLTKKNVNKIFNDITWTRDTSEGEYNLVIICSSFQLISVAYEIEKYFHESTSKIKPSSLLLIGGENIFEVVVNQKWLDFDRNIKKEICLKKMQSLLYEVYFHSLNKS